jgi:hypothetical protein
VCHERACGSRRIAPCMFDLGIRWTCQVYGPADLTTSTHSVLLVYSCNKTRGGSFNLKIINSIIRITTTALQLKATACAFYVVRTCILE